MYKLLDQSLFNHIRDADKDEQAEWLILEKHPDFKGHWIVNCLSPSFLFDFEEIIGPYRALSPAHLDKFSTKVEELEYKMAFGEDPGKILDIWEGLKKPPDFSINSDFEGTVNGFLPFQLQGFNFLKDLDSGIAKWSTGTGKTVLATALIKYHMAHDSFDTALIVVKAHNQINTVRKLLKLGGIESQTLNLVPEKRHSILETRAVGNQGRVLVTNYEKLRVDFDWFLPIFDSHRLLIIWDEMPNKLRKRTSDLYASIRTLLYRQKYDYPAVARGRRRPPKLRQYMLSAMPIEHSPEDWFNCVRLMDPRIYGSTAEFENEYVASYDYFDPDKPDKWHNLDKMGLKAAHITHQVDKEEPDIAKLFPQEIVEPYLIDWHPSHWKIYSKLLKKARKEIEGLQDANILGIIAVMQMLCDAPSMVNDASARREAYESYLETLEEDEADNLREPLRKGSEVAKSLLGDTTLSDKGHTKLEALEQHLNSDYKDYKALVYTTYNATLLPKLSGYLTDWGINHVVYRGTIKQKQKAQDKFRDDDSVQVFLSSDAGSDSLDLPEANLVINYDWPWSFATKLQRQNRGSRLGGKHKTLYVLDYEMANSFEGRKHQIVEKKFGFHKAVFQGISAQSVSSRMTRGDLMEMLGL